MNKEIIFAMLGNMTKEQLSTLATHLNVKKGNSKTDAIYNLAKAIVEGKARLKVTFQVKAPYPDPANPDPYMPALASGKIYSYKDSKAEVAPLQTDQGD